MSAFRFAPVTTPPSNPPQTTWCPDQYNKFSRERLRPIGDLIPQIKYHIPPRPRRIRILDLGCGPGNSTKELQSAWPGADIVAVDSSPVMLARAMETVEGVDFHLADLETFEVPENSPKYDLMFSNATLHWLRSPARHDTITRFMKGLKPGGVLAFQVPDNYYQPTHLLMRETASMKGKPWSQYFPVDEEGQSVIGNRSIPTRPDLDPIQSPSDFYNLLQPHAQNIDIWRTEYQHVFDHAGEIVEFVSGTGLRPFLQAIRGPTIEEDETARSYAKDAFLTEYKRRIKEAYPKLEDGSVIMGYPRLFVIAVKKPPN